MKKPAGNSYKKQDVRDQGKGSVPTMKKSGYAKMVQKHMRKAGHK